MNAGASMRDTDYALGHSTGEIDRLIKQAAFIDTITERLLRSAGIAPGMRVLDLGCGAGDVSFLSARLVGASGSVVGIDNNPEVLAVARRRAEAQGHGSVSFLQESVDHFAETASFDLVVSRYVLVFQADPVRFLRTAAAFARRGGIVALHEPVAHSPFHCQPHVELWHETVDRVRRTFRTLVPNWDAGGRLIRYFQAAGLPQPRLFCETLVGGGADAPHYAWLAGLAWTLLPEMIRLGVATAESVAIESLEERLRSEVVEAGGQVEAPAQICAWTTV
jgi:ubiquinone/menaquinone biosynthesis C-methylase UbiE